jgi:hypothetical protein
VCQVRFLGISTPQHRDPSVSTFSHCCWTGCHSWRGSLTLPAQHHDDRQENQCAANPLRGGQHERGDGRRTELMVSNAALVLGRIFVQPAYAVSADGCSRGCQRENSAYEKVQLPNDSDAHQFFVSHEPLAQQAQRD